MKKFFKQFRNSKGFVWSPEFGATIISIIVLVAIPTTLYLTFKSQDVRQQASSNVHGAVISIDPQSGVYSVGQNFAVTLLIDGGVEKLSGARATVGVSPNLVVNSLTLTQKDAGGCGFNYVNPDTKPTINNLSFYGILTDTYLSSCSLYTVILTPLSAGNASVFITEGDVLSNTNGKSIFKEAKNANFVITP